MGYANAKVAALSPNITAVDRFGQESSDYGDDEGNCFVSGQASLRKI